jgi:hypothetical protein
MEEIQAKLAALQSTVQSQAGIISNLQSKISTLESSSAAIETWKTNDNLWMMHHVAASAACAASSPESDSGFGHIVLPGMAGTSCTARCASTDWSNCRIAIAVGSTMTTQATSHDASVNSNYKYSCSDAQNSYDEVKGQGRVSSYSKYCCCYH